MRRLQPSHVAVALYYHEPNPTRLNPLGLKIHAFVIGSRGIAYMFALDIYISLRDSTRVAKG